MEQNKVTVPEMTALILLALVTDAAIIMAWFLVAIPILGEVWLAGLAVFKFLGDAFSLIYFWKKTGEFGKNGLVQLVAAVVEYFGLPTTTAATIAGIYLANHPNAAKLIPLAKKLPIK
jgi:hypothetical protein